MTHRFPPPKKTTGRQAGESFSFSYCSPEKKRLKPCGGGRWKRKLGPAFRFCEFLFAISDGDNLMRVESILF